MYGSHSSVALPLLTPRPAMIDDENEPTLVQQHKAAFREEAALIRQYGEQNWRVKTFQLLHDQRVILTLAFFMFLDIVLLLIGLLLESTYPECSLILPRLDCGASSCMMVMTDKGEFLKCDKQCVENPPSIDSLKELIPNVSICILLVFLFEIMINALVLGVRGFLQNSFLVFDFVIVVVSLGLEMATIMQHLSDAGDLQAITLPLLIFSRSWRLLRLGYSAYGEARDLYERRIDEVTKENDILKALVAGFERPSTIV